MMWPFRKSTETKPEPKPEPVYHCYVFQPQPDITTFELAWLYGHLNYAVAANQGTRPCDGFEMSEDELNNMPEGVRRHWKIFTEVVEETTEAVKAANAALAGK